MPRGVTDQFLRILDNERKHAVRTVLAMAALAVFAYFMAELTDEPLLGPVVWLSLAALAVGVGLGLVWAWRTTTRYGESLREQWNAWMRMSLSATRVHEVARSVANQGKRPPLEGPAWATLLLANVALFVALWVEAPWALAFGVAVTTANGLTLGALAGASLWNLRWARRFSTALDELVREGNLGLWGER
jgi:hypothetical protein